MVSWKKILEEIQLELAPTTFDSLFRKTELNQKDEHTWELHCINEGVRFVIERKHKIAIVEKLKKHGAIQPITLIVTAAEGRGAVQELGPLFPNNKEDNFALRLHQSNLNPTSSFDSFAVSVSNQIAHAAALAAATEPGNVYNPLFIWGGVGVGKTHLMQAVGRKIIESTDKRVLYCTAEEFTNFLVDSIRTKSTNLFRKKFRNMDALLLDDIQFISQRDFIQEELFNTFNKLYSQKKQIVFTSDKPPRAIRNIEARLTSRFLSGLVVDIQQPDFELKTAILLIKAQQKKMKLTIEAAKLISASIEEIREIEGFLLKLYSLKKDDEPITESSIERLISHQGGAPNNSKTNPKNIIQAVSHELNVTLKDIKGESRKKDVALARHFCMYFLKTLSDLTYEDIAAILGKKDHTTVMHGVQKIIKEISHNSNMRITADRIRLYFS